MLSLNHSKFSRTEILDAMLGKHGSRFMDFRFDLLDKEDKKIREITHLIVANSSSIEMNNDAEIHRTASFTMKDDGSVNFLSDRIQPWAVLRMPAVRQVSTVYEDIVGVNLLSSSNNISVDSTDRPAVVAITFSGGVTRIEVIGNGSNWNAYTFIQSYLTDAGFFSDVGEKYTISAEVRMSSANGATITFDTRTPDDSIYSPLVEFGDTNGTWQQVSSTMTIPDRTPQERSLLAFNSVGTPVIGDILEIRNIKLEKGDTATPWSPAIEDIGLEEYQNNWMRKTVKTKSLPSESIEFPLGVFLLSTPQKSYQNRNIYRTIEAYDKLQILLDDGFTSRYVADEGTLVTDVVKDIISSTGIMQINIEASDVRLPTWFSWDPDVSRLEVVNQLLQAINYEKIYVDEYGYFTSRPYRSPSIRSAEYHYKTDEWSVISPGATALQDFFAVPNQWVGVISEPDRVPLTYTYENTNPDSPTSIPARGRSVTKYIDVDAADIESLQGIVEKQAFQDSQVFTEMTFSTAIMPMHSHNDIYFLQHDILGANAKFQEKSWSMPLSAGAQMTHTAREIIKV